MDTHWKLILGGLFFVALAIITQLLNMRQTLRGNGVSLSLAGAAFIAGAAGAAFILVGLIHLVVHLAKT